MMKMAGSGSVFISQRHGSADPDPQSTPKCHESATLLTAVCIKGLLVIKIPRVIFFIDKIQSKGKYITQGVFTEVQFSRKSYTEVLSVTPIVLKY
jgi:hypothetical protein